MDDNKSELNIREKFLEVTESSAAPQLLFGGDTEKAEQIAEHRLWLQSIRKQRPLPSVPYKIGVYIRFFNQTKYDNYLDFHKKGFIDVINQCPKWTLIDFYIDEGSTAPNMDNAPEWCRLLDDCFSGKIDLILTQKISNVSRKSEEITLISSLLATQSHPVGIYFISEDIFTTASYYLDDMQSPEFFPEDWDVLPDDNQTRGMLND